MAVVAQPVPPVRGADVAAGLLLAAAASERRRGPRARRCRGRGPGRRDLLRGDRAGQRVRSCGCAGTSARAARCSGGCSGSRSSSGRPGSSTTGSPSCSDRRRSRRPGDLISLLAAPLAVAGVLAVPRRTAGAHPGLRLGLDSTLLGDRVRAAELALRVRGPDPAGRRSRPPTRPRSSSSWPTSRSCASGSSRSSATSTATCCSSRSAPPATRPGTSSPSTPRWPSPGNWPWYGAALWCLAWPLIAAGLLRYEPKALVPGRPRERDDRPGRARRRDHDDREPVAAADLARAAARVAARRTGCRSGSSSRPSSSSGPASCSTPGSGPSCCGGCTTRRPPTRSPGSRTGGCWPRSSGCCRAASRGAC